MLLPRSFEIGFHPVIRGINAYVPRTWYVGLCVNPRGRYQPFGKNSKIRYKFGNGHSSPPLRRQTAAAESAFLAVATTSSWPDNRIRKEGSTGERHHSTISCEAAGLNNRPDCLFSRKCGMILGDEVIRKLATIHTNVWHHGELHMHKHLLVKRVGVAFQGTLMVHVESHGQ